MIDRFTNFFSFNWGSSDDDNEPQYEEISPELAEEKLEQTRTGLSNLAATLDQTKLKREDREQIITLQFNLLKAVYKLTGEERPVEYYTSDNNPTLSELADFFQKATTHLQCDHVVNERILPLTQQIADYGQQIEAELRNHDEFEFAYEEKYRQSQQNLEIQSYGIPNGINPA